MYIEFTHLQTQYKRKVEEKQMEKHFSFGHTIEPIQVEEESDSNLDHLFRIGQAPIQIDKSPKQPNYISLSDSDSTPKIHEKSKKVKKQKHKKQHKHHHQDDQKQDKKKKKNKKDKKKKKQLSEEDLEERGSLVPFVPSKNTLLDIYQRQLEDKSKESKLLQLNKKIGQGLLPVDVLDFPQHSIFQHGLMDKDVPQYQKIPFINSIIGSSSKKQKDIVNSINKRINQKEIYPFSDEVSKHRYHHFEGYQNSNSQQLPYLRPFLNLLSFVPLGKTETFAQSSEEEKWLSITRQYNSKLNQNPNDTQLWIQFVNIQVKISNQSSNLQNTAILQRQISIIEKALSLNPKHLELGLLYINKLSQKHSDQSSLADKCRQFIEAHPSSSILWKIFLYIRLDQFNLFSHQMSRKVFEEVTYVYRKIIDSTRSALQLWKIRKSGLQLVKQQILLYKLQGYGQLATGLIVALMDFNFFMPEQVVKMTNNDDRVRIFGKYWEDHKVYKLGQMKQHHGWEDTLIGHKKEHEFIGTFQIQQDKNTSLSIFQNQMFIQNSIWRPAHPLRDKKVLERRPEAYVLIDDINFALHFYRDAENLNTLIDILADHLQLPTLFSYQGIHSQWGFSLVEKSLTQIINNRNPLYQYEKFYWWHRYWKPSKSQRFINKAKWIKLEYFRRILESVKLKIPASLDQINQYLVFIYCCYFSNKESQQLLKLEETQILQQLQHLLGESECNVQAWCIYIEAMFDQKQNLKECLSCYLQLLQTVQFMEESSQDIGKVSFHILFWLWKFVSSHSPRLSRSVLKLCLNLFDNRQIQLNLNEIISQIEEEQLQKVVKEKIKLLETQINNSSKKKILVQDLYIAFLCLDCLNQGFLKGLMELKQPVKNLLLQIFQQEKLKQCSQQFLLKHLIDQQLFKHENIFEKNMFVKYPSIELVEYWIVTNNKPLPIFLAQFELWQGKSLPIWMTCCIFLWKTSMNSQKYSFHDYFFKIGKKLCFENNLQDQHPQYKILLNKLLMTDTSSTNSEFIQYSLKKLPYSKQMYLINLQSNSSSFSQILAMMRDKNIRIFEKQLLN